MNSLLKAKHNLQNLFLILTLLLALPGKAYSVPFEELTQERLHQQSDFFLRIIYGMGWSESRLTQADSVQEVIKNGSSGYYTLQIGYTIFDNFILFGETGVVASNSPKAYINDVDTQKKIGRYNIPSIGFGATYYFMPLNLYVSLQLRVPELHYYVHESTTYLSSLGLGFGASVGWEWPFDRHWGAGVALQFAYDSPGLFKKDEYTLRENFYGGVSITATYN